MIFSIADLQGDEDQLIPNEGEEGSDEDGSEEASYPLRCSFTITKVCDLRPFHAVVASSEMYPQPSVPGAMSIDAVCQEGTDRKSVV